MLCKFSFYETDIDNQQLLELEHFGGFEFGVQVFLQIIEGKYCLTSLNFNCRHFNRKIVRLTT
jgi:hypothetical protein